MLRGRIQMAAAVLVSTLVITADLASARSGGRWEAPVKRLLANVTKALEESPDDPHLLYLAGRTHAIAYAQGADGTGRTQRPAESELPSFGTSKVDRLEFKGEIDEERLGHLRAGIRLLRRAADLAKPPPAGREWDDDRPFLHLGLAWLLDDGSRFAPRIGGPVDGAPIAELSGEERAAIDARIAVLASDEEGERKGAFDALRASFPRCWPHLVAHRDAKNEKVRTAVGTLLNRWWQDQALDAYRRSYELIRERDAADKGVLRGTFTISREAGEAILRLNDAPADDAAAKRERDEIAEHLKRLDARGIAVTPVLFPIGSAAPLASLLPAHRTARFDLAGDGILRTWPWPSADAGFLVWTPPEDRTVASGRRMFGSRTWWIFWRDGYEPLSMLDDDGDGRLAGAELEDLCVWRDADGDGVSDPGEVLPVAAHGIAWIAVTSARTEDGIPANDRGIGMTDGTTRPTYDWTPTSIPEPPSARE